MSGETTEREKSDFEYKVLEKIKKPDLQKHEKAVKYCRKERTFMEKVKLSSVKAIGKMPIEKIPYYECPSFDSCSAPLCPLDPDIDKRIRYPDEDKCKAHKTTRERIGRKYPELLPYQGLTKREWAGKKRSDSLTPSEKNELLRRLKKGKNRP